MAQGDLQPDMASSEKSLGTSELDSQDRYNRNSNMTMVGNSNATTTATTATSALHGQSPLRSEQDSQDYHNNSNNSNSSLSHNEEATAAVTLASAKLAAPSGFWSRMAHSKTGRLWLRFINSETGRFVSSVVYFAVVCIGMAFCNQFSDHRWIDTGYRYLILDDRGFDIFPALKEDTPANIFVMTSIVFTVIGMVFICPNWTSRGIVLRRVLWVVGTLSVYRALTLSVTTLPSPKKDCKPADDRTFGGMLWIAIQMIPGTVEACTDDIFSGHTVFM